MQDTGAHDPSKIFAFAKNESGATAIEYGLIAALVGVAIITAVTTLGTKLSGTFGNVSAKL
ncbi:MAG: Flp family type IVb pilin [Rhizobiales bacterium]|nr:Flp family type IVb pilin [Hyphomicrobiales bacterium]